MIDSQRTINSVDIVIFVARIDGNMLVQLSDIYNETSFLLCAPRFPDYEQFSNNNIDYYWAELYQSWFLSGYLAGLMIDPKEVGTICYIQTLNDNYNRLLLNAFSHGVLMANKNVTIPVWIAGTTENTYILSSLATEILYTAQCDQVATNAFAVLVFRPFTESKKFVRFLFICLH
jgi:basic membrane lipoprotein Med (substrate-binding protein (PBP1-ABC) superfamily)